MGKGMESDFQDHRVHAKEYLLMKLKLQRKEVPYASLHWKRGERPEGLARLRLNRGSRTFT